MTCIDSACSASKCFINGSVCTPNGMIKTDVLVKNGKIVALGSHLDFTLEPNAECIDCSGRLILPGFIDAHCHIQLDTGIFHTSDDWWDGSQEAARGGITTVVDFVGPQPGEDLHDALMFRMGQAKLSLIDYTFHMTVLDASDASLNSVEKCPSWGISSLKLYTTYKPNYYLDDESIILIMERAAKCGLSVLIHCENDAIVSRESARIGDDNLWVNYPARRPANAEAEAVNRMIAFAEYTHARVVIAHNSCPETIELVQNARKRNVKIFNETGPQYLFLDSSCNTASTDPWRYILQPPLRDPSCCAKMCQQLAENGVDMLITDHCSYTKDQKISNPQSTPGGLPGFETLFSVTAANAGLPLEKVVQMLSENPAKIYGLWPRKGAIAPGFDADLLIVDDQLFTIDENNLHTFAGYSPFNGKKGRGIIERVFRRGEEIVRNGKTIGQQGSGAFIHADVNVD